MNEINKTLVFSGLAGAFVALAYFTSPQPSDVATKQSRMGQALFGTFESTEATGIEIVEIDEEESSDINVVLVADVDVLTNAFYDIRSNPNQFPAKLDNVTLSLNLIDHLSKEERLLEIRNRRRLHRTLEEFEESIEDAREVASETIAKAKDSMDQIISEEFISFLGILNIEITSSY